MIRRLRDFRLIPVVLGATICLFALKTFGLIFDGGYTLNELTRSAGDDVEVTGAVGSPSGAASMLPLRNAAAPATIVAADWRKFLRVISYIRYSP